VGEVANTNEPDPVSSVIAVARLALEGVAKKVATFAPRPLTPVLIGRPVQFVKVPEVGVPKRGVTKVGEVAKTSAPEPVSSVTAVAKLALEGVARKVDTFAPRPLTPVLIGRPVQFVSVPEVGVPKIGVTKVGEVANTKAPDPVSSEITPLNSSEVVAPTLVLFNAPMAIFAVPSKDVPPMVLAFCKAVAVAALPVMLPVIALVTVMSVAHNLVSRFVVSPMVCPEV
jgi:hypothetical protein